MKSEIECIEENEPNDDITVNSMYREKSITWIKNSFGEQVELKLNVRQLVQLFFTSTNNMLLTRYVSLF